ncbi:hypothetical protein [Butyrivibrio fibrisolvens]|uniref:hypothetical protein n=1 Tax=Butyrivibrio fibrisolvens TaxID=831 RepID=UPI0003B7A9D0|nr:hypothetical protein [Butyrivibrio fibrisolvens]
MTSVDMSSVVIILVAAAVFLALIVWFTVDVRHVKKWTGISFLIAIAGGLIIYGAIDADQFKDMPVIAVLRTVVHVGRMFGNAGDGSHDAFVGIVGDSIFTSMFYWLVHFFAYYSVVSALVLAIGKDIVKIFRTWLLRFRDIELIYGINDDSIRLGETLARNRRISLVFVGTGSVPDSLVNRTGALVYDDPEAMNAGPSFLKRMSVKKGTAKIRISALSMDDEANYSYAVRMRSSLKETDISPSNTELVMFARAASLGNELQNFEDNYGYGSVKVFDRRELASRLLFREHPIADVITFDDKGRAMDDAHILMVGFGNIGQEMLRRIVALGQFEGSTLHVHIFDPAIDKIDGYFKARYPGLLDNYDISFKAADARSSIYTEYVREEAENLKYIIIATGNESVGNEIAYGTIDILASCGIYLPVYQCYYDKIIRNHYKDECIVTKVIDDEILYGTKLDAISKEINHFYYGEGDADEQWKRCDYFSRMSCNASADYLLGLMNRLGLMPASTKSEKLVAGSSSIKPNESEDESIPSKFMESGDESLAYKTSNCEISNTISDIISGEFLENLAKSEHLRWMGFHYSMGYQPMTKKQIDERVRLYQKDSSVRILKDVEHKRHGCLVPWDDLDELSDFENSYTGKNVDYKQMDRENVKAVCKIISQMIDKGTA